MQQDFKIHTYHAKLLAQRDDFVLDHLRRMAADLLNQLIQSHGPNIRTLRNTHHLNVSLTTNTHPRRGEVKTHQATTDAHNLREVPSPFAIAETFFDHFPDNVVHRSIRRRSDLLFNRRRVDNQYTTVSLVMTP